MAVIGAHKIEELFKEVAGLTIHKEKVKALSELIDEKFHDLLLIGQANAKYNGREIIWYSDLPLTKAFRESMQKFSELETKLEMSDVLEHIKTLPPMYALEVELEEKLTEIVGTLLYIFAKIARTLSRDDRVVSAEEFEEAKELINLMI